MTRTLPCRFAEHGCRSPAAGIWLLPAGCACWQDRLQALCEQHALTCEPIDEMVEVLRWRRCALGLPGQERETS